MQKAMQKATMIEQFLVKPININGKIKFDQQFPVQLNKSVFLSGQMEGPGSVDLLFGNNSTVTKTESIQLNELNFCSNDDYTDIQMLQAYRIMIRQNNWQEYVRFGLTYNVVTPQTAFIVLEKIED